MLQTGKFRNCLSKSKSSPWTIALWYGKDSWNFPGSVCVVKILCPLKKKKEVWTCLNELHLKYVHKLTQKTQLCSRSSNLRKISKNHHNHYHQQWTYFTYFYIIIFCHNHIVNRQPLKIFSLMLQAFFTNLKELPVAQTFKLWCIDDISM